MSTTNSAIAFIYPCQWGSGVGGFTAASAGSGAQTEKREQARAQVSSPYDSYDKAVKGAAFRIAVNSFWVWASSGFGIERALG